MRKLGTVLFLGLAFGVACSSTEETTTPPTEAQADELPQPEETNPSLADAEPFSPSSDNTEDAWAEITDDIVDPVDDTMEAAAFDDVTAGMQDDASGDELQAMEDEAAMAMDDAMEDAMDDLAAESIAAQEALEAQEAQEQSASELLDDTAQYLTLAEQKRHFLVEQHLTTARTLMERVALTDAESELGQALTLDPDNLEAKQMMAEVGVLLGRPDADLGVVPSDLADRWQVRVEQLQVEARESFRKSEVLLARGDYDAAIAELTITRNYIRWAPYGIDWRGLDRDVDEMLSRAKAERGSAIEAQELAAEAEAWERLRSEELNARDRREAQKATLLSEAIEAFDAGDYDAAQDLASRVLSSDPRNSQAQDINETAFRAGRKQAREDYIQTKRERYQQWYEDLDKDRIPFTSTVTLPDREFWEQISELRADRSSVDPALTKSPEDLRIIEQLSTMTIPGLIVEDEEDLRVVIDIIRTYTGLPLVVHPAAEIAATDEGAVFTYDLKNPLTVDQSLNIITRDAGPEVTWTVRSEAVIITTREEARAKPTIKNHDVQDLVFGLTDFLAPRIDRLRLLDDLEDDDGGGPFGGIGEHPKLIDMSNLTALIQENVAVGTWEDDGVSIDEGEGYILVVHSPEVQGQVESFLEDLRRFTSTLVTIESKFISIEDNYIQEIGVDFRGLDNPGQPFTDLDDVTNGLEDMASQGLDNLGTGSEGAGASGAPSSGFFYDDGNDGDFKGRIENFFGSALGSSLSTVGGATVQYTFLNDLELSAILTAVEKTSQVQLVNDQLLSVHNTQRAYVSVINQQAYIQDFDVEVAQFQSIADPQINVLTEGVVLDVRPTILHNRSYLRLEIQPTVANVVAIRPFSTTLGGGTQPVEFQLPELEVQSVFTTAVIPDGGSILIGGLSNIRNVERRAEVPWIAKVPVVGFFFKQEGYSDENKSLMILIRAHITDVREELARLEGR